MAACGSGERGPFLGKKFIFALPEIATEKERRGIMKLHTTAAVAKFLNLTDRRVRQLRDEGVIREIRPGLYNLLEVNHAYIDYLKGDTPVEEKISYHEERAKLVRAKRQNQELDLRLRERELHESAEVEAVISEMLANFKVRLMAIPAKLSPLLASKKSKTEIYKIMSEAVEEALQELSDFQTAFAIEKEEEIEEEGGSDES